MKRLIGFFAILMLVCGVSFAQAPWIKADAAWHRIDSPAAPSSALYWVGATNAGLPNAKNLGGFTGIVLNTAGTPSGAAYGDVVNLWTTCTAGYLKYDGTCSTPSTGANTALSNLSAVAINSALLPGTAGALDFGSTTKPWGDLYFAGTSATPATNHFKITGSSAGGLRTLTIPDADSVAVIPDTGAANNFLTAVSAGGVISKAQPSCGSLSDSGSHCTDSTSYLPLAGGTLTGNLLFSTDNTLDIGASGATRPRTGYFGTSVVIGAGSAITSSGAGGALGSNAFTSTAYAPLASPTFTGTVTLPTGATGAVPLLFASGSLKTSPVAGGFEFLTDNIYFTITTGAARKTIAFTDSNISGTAAGVSSTLVSGSGGTGVANTATLTLGSSNVNLATLGTGIVKNTTTTGALTNAAYGDVVALWTSCTSGFLKYDGTCVTPTGGGTVTSSGSPLVHQVAVFTTGTDVTGVAVGATDKPLVGVTSNDPVFSKLTLTNPATAATLTLADNKTFTVNNTITLAAGADSQTFTFPASSDTIAGLGTAQSFTANQTFSGASIIISGNISAAAWTTNGIRIKGTPGTLTDTTSSGTVAAAYTDVLGGNTINSTNSNTFTNYFSVYAKDPVQGTATFTNKWAIGADSMKVGTSNPFSVGNAGHVTAEGVTSTGATGSGKFVFDTSPSFTTGITIGAGSAITSSGGGGALGSNAFNSTAFVPTSTTVNGHALSGNVSVTTTDLSLNNLSNDLQTKASIVPNAAPSAGQTLVGNAGGTAYAAVSLSGSGATFSLSSAGVLTVSAIPNTSLSNSSMTIAGTSTALGGTITQDTITGLSSTGIVKRTGANTLGVVSTTRMLGWAFGDVTNSSALTTSEVGYLTSPFACTITGWHIMVDAGTATVKTWRVNGGTALPTSSNSISTSGVAISSGTKVDSTTVTDFTSTAIAANDTLGFAITAVATAKILVFQIDCSQ